MSSPSDYLSNVWQQYVPQGHDKALKQAVYTTVSNLLILVAIAAVVAVYFILEAFLKPLLWAVLCGTFVYPFKSSLTNIIRNWMKRLKKSGTPLAVGVVLLPITSLDSAANALSDQITRNFKIIIGIAAGVPLLYLFYHFGPLQYIFGILTFLLWFLDSLIRLFSSMWIWSIFVAYILVQFVYWSPETQNSLSHFSILIWIIFFLHIASWTGPLGVPLFLAAMVILIIGLITDIKLDKAKADKDTELKDEVTAQEVPGSQPVAELKKDWALKRLTDESHDVSKESHDVSKKPPDVSKPSSLKLSVKQPPSPIKTGNSALTSQCFMALLWGHILVRLWMHLWIILLLLVLPFVLMLFKKLGATVSSDGMFGEKFKYLKETSSAWFESHKDILVPRSIRGLLRLALRGDRKIITVLEQGMDKMTTILLILALLIGTLLFAILGAVQVHQESMLIVTMTSTLLNDTLHPEFSQWLPNSKDMTDAVDSVVGNAYHYGRDWIALKIQNLVDDGAVNKTQIEQQVLEVVDMIYDSWFSKNTSFTKTKADSSNMMQFPDYSNISALWEYASQGNGLFDISKVVTFAQDNIGTLMSVLDSVWLVIKGNMSLVSSLVSAIISMILGGGTAVLNFVISAVIFLTTLFYLLASSGRSYKPVEWFTSMSPNSSGFGQAVEEAISSVFKASLKMSAFYGLFTWLTHIIFNVDIVFIPSVLAAIFGAVPFVGTFWAAFPGALELWVLKGEGIMAITLIIIHMLPAYFVDTAIYSEIKGGHPYVTGLAIAGGMYSLGLEGAFIGPILLCCLIVVVNMYGTMLKPDSTPRSA